MGRQRSQKVRDRRSRFAPWRHLGVCRREICAALCHTEAGFSTCSRREPREGGSGMRRGASWREHSRRSPVTQTGVYPDPGGVPAGVWPATFRRRRSVMRKAGCVGGSYCRSAGNPRVAARGAGSVRAGVRHARQIGSHGREGRLPGRSPRVLWPNRHAAEAVLVSGLVSPAGLHGAGWTREHESKGWNVDTQERDVIKAQLALLGGEIADLLDLVTDALDAIQHPACRSNEATPVPAS